MFASACLECIQCDLEINTKPATVGMEEAEGIGRNKGSFHISLHIFRRSLSENVFTILPVQLK